MPADALDELCARAGIERVYFDQLGARHEIGAETGRAIAAALGPGGASDARPGPAAPGRAYMPAEIEAGAGVWGIAVQLYALRSPRDWGIGDFGVLKAFIGRAAAAGAAAVGLNPLHALYLDEPERASPYSPNSRAHVNPLYIDVEAVPDFGECRKAQLLAQSPAFRAALRRLRESALVDYRGVADCKLRLLEMLYASFRQRHLAQRTARAGTFRAFQGAEGAALRRFSVFQALREARGSRDAAQRAWRNWPAPLSDPAAPAVAEFAAENIVRVEYFEYLQWLAEVQLAECAAAAGAMPIGLYRDLAVGVDADAGEAWAERETIVGGFTVGAPPDLWNRKGQDWGLAPLNPAALRRLGYRPFVALIRANMRHAGALRIDHVLGLWRSFWIRQGDEPGRGAYVRYPFADLVGILVRESRRRRCVVVGEDLGTVPPGLRSELARAGILSYRLLYFERRDDGRPCRPEDYPRQALVSIGTHDLPTLPAYWQGADLAVRAGLGFFSESGQLEAERERRAMDRVALTAALSDENLLGGGVPDLAPVEAAYRFLARTPGRILMVQLEDALGLAMQINVPSTPDAPPNWRQRIPLGLDAIFSDAGFRMLCASLNRERPRPR